MKYTNREDIEPDVRKRYEAIAAIYGELKKKRKTVSNVDLMVEINNIISEYVPTVRYKSTLICFDASLPRQGKRIW